MALGVKILAVVPAPPEKVILAQFALDNNYPAGGYVLTPAMFGLAAFATQSGPQTGLTQPMILSIGGGGATPLLCDVDQNTGALRVYYPTGGANPAPAAIADPAGTVPVGATAVTSTAAQPGLALTPGRAKEVAAATNLTGLLVVLMAVGH